MIYRNPVLVWLNEMRPDAPPHRGPPPGPFIVTRSEVLIRNDLTPRVYIWFALVPAERKTGGEAHDTPSDLRRA